MTIISSLFFVLVSAACISGIQAGEHETDAKQKRELTETEILSAIKKTSIHTKAEKVKQLDDRPLFDVFSSPSRPYAHIITYIMGDVLCTRTIYPQSGDNIACSHADKVPSRPAWNLMHKLWQKQEAEKYASKKK